MKISKEKTYKLNISLEEEESKQLLEELISIKEETIPLICANIKNKIREIIEPF